MAVLDKGYDGEPMYDECESRGIRPVIALKETPAVKAGKHKPPSCEHGEWTFAGSDAKRGASKWRCPTGECQPASVWIKADRLHPLIPHGTERWKALYRQRTAVETSKPQCCHNCGLLSLPLAPSAVIAMTACWLFCQGRRRCCPRGVWWSARRRSTSAGSARTTVRLMAGCR